MKINFQVAITSDIALDLTPADEFQDAGVDEDGYIKVYEHPSKWMQWKDYKKSFDVEICNRFEAFESDIETDCESFGEFFDEEIKVELIRKVSKKKINNEIKSEKMKKKARNLDKSCLEKFETKNRFDVLINNPEENVPKILKRNSLLST